MDKRVRQAGAERVQQTGDSKFCAGGVWMGCFCGGSNCLRISPWLYVLIFNFLIFFIYLFSCVRDADGASGAAMGGCGGTTGVRVVRAGADAPSRSGDGKFCSGEEQPNPRFRHCMYLTQPVATKGVAKSVMWKSQTAKLGDSAVQSLVRGNAGPFGCDGACGGR